MKQLNKFLAVIAAVFAMALVASAAQPVIYTLNLSSYTLTNQTILVTNPVWTTSSGGVMTNLDVQFQSQFTLYCVAQAGPTTNGFLLATNGAVTISGLVSPDGVYFTPSNAPPAFTVGLNTNNLVVATPYSNQPATSWRYWGGVLTVTVGATNFGIGPAYTNSTLQLKSFWKLP